MAVQNGSCLERCRTVGEGASDGIRGASEVAVLDTGEAGQAVEGSGAGGRESAVERVRVLGEHRSAGAHTLACRRERRVNRGRKRGRTGLIGVVGHRSIPERA
jgi:hypothetical protein